MHLNSTTAREQAKLIASHVSDRRAVALEALAALGRISETGLRVAIVAEDASPGRIEEWLDTYAERLAASMSQDGASG